MLCICMQAQQQTHLPMPNSNPHKQTQLMDLDDACLLMVFKHLMPLPDLFCCAQTCWVRRSARASFMFTQQSLHSIGLNQAVVLPPAQPRLGRVAEALILVALLSRRGNSAPDLVGLLAACFKVITGAMLDQSKVEHTLTHREGGIKICSNTYIGLYQLYQIEVMITNSQDRRLFSAAIPPTDVRQAHVVSSGALIHPSRRHAIRASRCHTQQPQSSCSSKQVRFDTYVCCWGCGGAGGQMCLFVGC